MNEVSNNITLTYNQVLLSAMELTGFNPKNISPEGFQFIIEKVKENKFTPELINKAFNMGMSGKLDFDMTTYQSFNVLYISNVIQSYKRWLISENIKPKPIEVKELPLPKMPIDEYFDFFEADFKKNGVPPIADWDTIFKILEDKGEISMSKAENRVFASEVSNDLKRSLKATKAPSIARTIEDVQGSGLGFENECRKRLVIKHYKI